ncbi:MAG: immunoglobulin domain-containing protein, partial [Flavobacteriales bacterium]
VGQGGLVGGTAGKGGDTYLSRNITPLVVAIGGNNGSRNSQNGALGGSFAGSLGDVTYGGGNGANGSRDAFGGGGGSSAGSAANGVSATGSAGALAPTGGGNGGNGALPASASTAGQLYGGGGGGSLNIQSQSRPAAAGANGIMRVSWSVSCIAPAISVQPLATTDLCAGASLNLSVTASGTPLNYQWKKNGNNLSGQTASSLQIAAVSAGDAGSYTVTISNACGTITSSPAVVTVNNAPVITTQPAQAGAVCTGGTLNLSVSSSGTSLSYAWFKNGVSISAATASTLSLSNVTSADAGNYTVTVSNACGSTTSSPASVNINGAVSIASQSPSQTPCQSQLIQLSVTPAGDLNSILNYSWFLNGALQPSVTGSTNDFIADPTTAGTYTVVINTLCGAVNANPITVTVKPRYSIDLPEVFACGSYTLPWGTVVYSNGSYSYSYITSDGCDSTINVAVNITPTVQSFIYITECDSFIFKGTTYYNSQHIVFDTLSTGGCDSIVNLHLTINNSEIVNIIDTACVTYTWVDGITTFSQSGQYVINEFTTDSCTRTINLDITIISPTGGVDTVTTCAGAYDWLTSGETYYTSGVYTNINDDVCSYDTLLLTFTTSYTNVTNPDSIPALIVCEPFTWLDGITYTAPSDSILVIYQSPPDPNTFCDSLIGYYLTVLPSSISYDSVTTCSSSYTWAISCENYTQ